MLTIQGRPRRVCNGLTRRDVLRAGGAGLLGTSLTTLLAAEEAGQIVRPRAKSVLFLFLFGGPSQLETFDLKPDAPAEIRGEFKPAATAVAGISITEHLPIQWSFHALERHWTTNECPRAGRKYMVP